MGALWYRYQTVQIGAPGSEDDLTSFIGVVQSLTHAHERVHGYYDVRRHHQHSRGGGLRKRV